MDFAWIPVFEREDSCDMYLRNVGPSNYTELKYKSLTLNIQSSFLKFIIVVKVLYIKYFLKKKINSEIKSW
jgi:hypothetical protein